MKVTIIKAPAHSELEYKINELLDKLGRHFRDIKVIDRTTVIVVHK